MSRPMPDPAPSAMVEAAFERARKAPWLAKCEACPDSFARSPTGSMYASPHVQAAFEQFRSGYWSAASAENLAHTPPLPDGDVGAMRAALDGNGHVFLNPDTGIEWAADHPVDSGEVPDAEDIRRSTGFEDHIVRQLQAALATPQPDSMAGEGLAADIEASTHELAAIHRRLILDIEQSQQRKFPPPDNAWNDCGAIIQAMVVLELCKERINQLQAALSLANADSLAGKVDGDGRPRRKRP